MEIIKTLSKHFQNTFKTLHKIVRLLRYTNKISPHTGVINWCLVAIFWPKVYIYGVLDICYMICSVVYFIVSPGAWCLLYEIWKTLYYCHKIKILMSNDSFWLTCCKMMSPPSPRHVRQILPPLKVRLLSQPALIIPASAYRSELCLQETREAASGR